MLALLLAVLCCPAAQGGRSIFDTCEFYWPGVGIPRFDVRFFGRGYLQERGASDIAEAIERGLDWLSRQQLEDGSWSAEGPQTGNVGVTALAVVALLGDGNTTRDGRHRHAVTRGVKWLMARQNGPSDPLGAPMESVSVRDRALAALALCETFVDSKSPLLKGPTQRAIDALLDLRPSTPGVGPVLDDVSAGWIASAMSMAKAADLSVTRDPTHPSWSADRVERARSDAALRPRGMLSSSTELFDPWRDSVLQLIEPSGDPNASEWLTWVRARVVKTQTRDGDAAGSWAPSADGAAWPSTRVAATALAVLQLESGFRRLTAVSAR